MGARELREKQGSDDERRVWTGYFWNNLSNLILINEEQNQRT